MLKGKTTTGFRFEIDERVLNDWRLITNISLAESDDLTDKVKGVTALVDLLLGKNQEKLMDHISKKNNGFIPIDAIINELASIITSTSELKNSQSSPAS